MGLRAWAFGSEAAKWNLHERSQVLAKRTTGYSVVSALKDLILDLRASPVFFDSSCSCTRNLGWEKPYER
jgi:hypothetical protein